MYKLLLILKYLRKRRIAWVSLAAVCLCTTMVLVVISVMGGWLRMFRTSFHGLSGDVVVQANSLSGFPNYQEMIVEIQKLPEVQAAVPTLQTFGLINIDNQKTMGVQVLGLPIDRIGQVNEFPKSLFRQYSQWNDWAEGKPMSAEDRWDLRILEGYTQVREADGLLKVSDKERAAIREALPKVQEKAKALRAKAPQGNDIEAENAEWMVGRLKNLADNKDPVISADERLAINKLAGKVLTDADELLKPNDDEQKLAKEQAGKRLAGASFAPFLAADEYKAAFRRRYPKAKPALVEESAHWPGMFTGNGVVSLRKNAEGKLDRPAHFLYTLPVKLTVMGVSDSGQLDPTGGKAERNYWITDTSRTKVWQYDSNTIYVPFDILQKDLGMDEQTAERDGKTIMLPGRTSEIHVRVKPQFRDSSADLVKIRDKVQLVIDQVIANTAQTTGWTGRQPTARTWEQSQAKWLGAIEKEMVLVTALFGLISIVAIFLIFCIFYMIVAEKIRDIGIIKSVGATNMGVAGIFLGYGAVIGIVGAGLGLLLGYTIVHNINEIHTWLGTAMSVQVWDPEVYAFDTIPNTMDPVHVFRIVGAAIVASILGALIPAVRAARLNPVEALRWE